MNISDRWQRDDTSATDNNTGTSKTHNNIQGYHNKTENQGGMTFGNAYYIITNMCMIWPIAVCQISNTKPEHM